MGFTVNWHTFLPTPDGDGNFFIAENDVLFLDFGAQYGDDPSRAHPTKHVVGLRFQGTAAHNIRAWLASTRAEVIPADTKKPLPRVDVEAVDGSPLRHPSHVIAGQTITLAATRDDNPSDASIDPYKVVVNAVVQGDPDAWSPSVAADAPNSVGGTITISVPEDAPLGSGTVYVRDQATGKIYQSAIEVVDTLFKFHGCRATDADTYSDFVGDWPEMPTSEASAIPLLDAPLNKQFEAYSQPLGIGCVVPKVLHTDYDDITLQNLRLLAAFDTYDQP